MKNTTILALSYRLGSFCVLSLVLLWTFSPLALAWKISNIEGVLSFVSEGTDSLEFEVWLEGGKSKWFRVGPVSPGEGLSPHNFREFSRTLDSLPGAQPIDMSSVRRGERVRIWFLNGEEPVKFQVLEGARIGMWFVIIASDRNEQAAEGKLKQAVRQGLRADILWSSNYPPLREGFHVVTTGHFRSQADAERQLAIVRRAGWGDAYIRHVL